jgi:nitrate reductase gamma subunit
MSDPINTVLFGWYPYLVLVVFAAGSWLRFAGEQHIVWSGSGPLLRRQQLTWGVTLFHGGILILFVGHFTGLLIPIRVFDAVGMSHSFKQWMAVVIGGVAGVAGLIGMTMLLHRRLFDARIRATSSFGDIAILLLIEIQLILGLGTIVDALVEYIDGCAILNFMSWAQDILIMKPAVAAAQVANVPLIFKLHMINGMTIVLVFPFTRLVNIWSVPARLGGRGLQAARGA